MISLIIIVGLNLLAAIIAFNSTEGLINTKTSSNRKIRFPLSTKGTVLLFSFLGVMGLSIWQHSEDEDEKRLAKEDTKKELTRRDSLAKVDQDRRDSASYANTLTALARYGLKYDSAQKTIEKLVRDSSKLTYISAANPDLFVCPGGIVLKEHNDSSYSFNVSFCNNTAPSTDITVRLYTVFKDDKGKFHGVPGSFPMFSNHRRIPAETELSKLVGFKSVVKIDQVFFSICRLLPQ